jgi:hypothetical protein
VWILSIEDGSPYSEHTSLQALAHAVDAARQVNPRETMFGAVGRKADGFLVTSSIEVGVLGEGLTFS